MEVEDKLRRRIWIAKDYANREDDLVCAVAVLEDALVVETVIHRFTVGIGHMKTLYFPQDDILEMRFSDKPIVRETTQDWNVNVAMRRTVLWSNW